MRRRSVPHLPGVLAAAAARATAAAIAAAQEGSGAIPWEPGRDADPWDHVEAAMALDACGLADEARAALAWLLRVQRPDGGFARAYRGGAETDATAESNMAAYLAVGVWHHHLLHGDRDDLAAAWPAVQRAVGWVLALQAPGGEVAWACDPRGRPDPTALVTGCSSILLSLRCALAAAAALGEDRPDWELAAGELGHALAWHPERFADRSRYSMDWYYPVLGGAVRGGGARARLDADWDRFVVPGRGARCVADRPWVTAAETSELVLALDVTGDRGEAAALLRAVQRLRDAGGGYWTGIDLAAERIWPVERTTWTAAAVLLATDALSRTTPASGLFRGEGLPAVADLPCAAPTCPGRTAALSG